MSSSRRILAIETSGRAGSICVADGTEVLARAGLATDARHAGDLHAQIDRLVRGQGWPPDSLDEVHVSAGPGSFTGVRIGVTVARTLAWATGAKLVRVPTVDALARNALLAQPPPDYVAVVLDAKRRQVFAALFALAEPATCTYRKIVDALMVEPGAFLAGALGAGDERREVAVLGEGIDYHREAIEQSGVRILPRELWPARAEGVLAVGCDMAAAGRYCKPEDCVPIYVRLPEPEEKWREKQSRQPTGPRSPQP